MTGCNFITVPGIVPNGKGKTGPDKGLVIAGPEENTARTAARVYTGLQEL